MKPCVSGDEYGFKTKLDAWNTDASTWLYGGTATYSTSNDDCWSRALVAYNLGSFFLGPEFIAQGNDEYEEQRLGLAVAGLQLGAANVGLSVGWSWADPDQGTNDEDGLYGSVHVSFAF